MEPVFLSWGTYGPPLVFSHIHTPFLAADVSLGPPYASCRAGPQVSPLVLEVMCSFSFRLQTQLQPVIKFIEQIFLLWGERTANSWRCHIHFIDDLGTGSLGPGLGDLLLLLTLSFQQTHSMLWTIPAFPGRCEKKCKSFHLSILPINCEVLDNGLRGFMSKLCYTTSIH